MVQLAIHFIPTEVKTIASLYFASSQQYPCSIASSWVLFVRKKNDARCNTVSRETFHLQNSESVDLNGDSNLHLGLPWS